jgi:hypothetical protein
MSTSLWGLRVSSAVVATMSKPMQHERDHEQRHEVVVEARRRSVEPRRQLDPEDFEHADEVS